MELDLVEEVATRTNGYSGADLQALCAESSMIALKQCYPQVNLLESLVSLSARPRLLWVQLTPSLMTGLTVATESATDLGNVC